MNARRNHIIAISLLLAGCSPKVVTVPVPEYVKVPAELLQAYPCGRPVATNGDLLAAYAECVEAARRHEADKRAIQSIGGRGP